MKFNLSQPNKVLVLTVHSGLHLHTGIRLLALDISFTETRVQMRSVILSECILLLIFHRFIIKII